LVFQQNHPLRRDPTLGRLHEINRQRNGGGDGERRTGRPGRRQRNDGERRTGRPDRCQRNDGERRTGRRQRNDGRDQRNGRRDEIQIRVP